MLFTIRRTSQDPSELVGMINLATKLRATAATGVHDQSSRSHAVCRIFVDGAEDPRSGSCPGAWPRAPGRGQGPGQGPVADRGAPGLGPEPGPRSEPGRRRADFSGSPK